MKVEGTTDTSISDDRFEDLGAVDLPPLPLALPQHVCGVGDLRGGERVAGQGRLPEQFKDVGKYFGKVLLGKKLEKCHITFLWCKRERAFFSIFSFSDFLSGFRNKSMSGSVFSCLNVCFPRLPSS